jgi:hypothetical protein|tara:strand:+ start:1218 stop:2060 length:843 start_codon:yes stop_codon:yes gene_type:complete
VNIDPEGQTEMTKTPSSIRASLQYLAAADDGGAVYHASQAGGAAAEHDGSYDYREMEVRNGRDRSFDLDKAGFMLVPHTSKLSDFHDDDAIASIYEDEARALVSRITGACRVVIFDHTRRAASDGLRRAQTMREPSAVIHNDYTQWSAEKRLREILPDEAEALMTRRFAIINVWRSIAGRVESHPLAFCDSTSLADGDLVEVTRQAKDRVGQIQMARFNPAHEWYYFPAMEPGEAALIKTYDSATDGRNRFTIHTAFDDPTSPPDAAPRQSIETRCFAFF